MADDDAGAHRATLRVELFAVIAPSSTGTPATVTTLRYRLGGLPLVAGAPVDVVAGGGGAFSVVAAAPPPQPGRPPPQPVAATGPTVAPPPPPLLLRHQSAAFTVLVDTACAVHLARDPLLSLHVGLNPAAPAVLGAGKGGAKAPPTSGKAGPPPCSATTVARNDFAAMLPVDCSALLGNASSVVWSCGDAHAAAAAAAAVPPLPAVATAATSSAPPADALAPLEAALGLAAGALARTASPLPAPPGLAWLAVCVHVQSAAAPVAAAAPPPAQAPVPGGGATKRAAAPVATAGAAAGRKSGATAGSDVPPGFAPVQPPVLLSPRLLLRLCPLRVSLRSVCGLPSAPAPSTDGCSSSSSSSSSSILPQPFMVLRLTSLSPAPLLPPGTCPTESVLLPSVGGAAHTPPSTADCGEDALVEPAVVLTIPPPTPLDGGSTLTLGVTSVLCLGLLLPRPPAGAVDGAAAASQDDGPGRAAALLRELLETRTLTLELYHNHTQWAAEGCTGHVEAGAGGGSSATAAARGPWYALPPWRAPHYQAVACGRAAPSSQLQSLADATPPSDAGSASTTKQNKDAAAAAAVVPPASAVSVRVAPATSGSAATPPGGVAAAAALLDAADRLATSELTARALSAGERHPHAIACVRLAPLVAVLDADAAAAALPWAVAPSGTSARAVAPRACVELVGQFVPASRRTRPPRPQSPQAPPPLPQQQPQPALQELAHSPCVGASPATAPTALTRREALLVLDTAAAAAAAAGVARSIPPPPTPPAPDRPALLQLAAPLLDFRAARVKLCVELLAPPAAVGRAATPGSQQRGGDSLLPPLAADGASLARGGVAHDATAAATADGTAAGGGSVAEELPRPLPPPPASLLSLSARGASLAGGPPNSLSLSDPPMMSAARPPPAAADQPAGGGRGATSTARAARRARRGRRHSKLSVREIMATHSSSSSRGGRAVGAAAARRAARGSSCVDHVRSHREFVARLSASASRARAAAAPRVLDAATGVDVTPPGCATLSQLRDALLAAAADGEFTYSFAPAEGSHAAALEPYAPPPGDALLLRPASNPAKWPGRRGFVLSGAAAPSCAEAVAAAQPPPLPPPPPLPETVCHPPLPSTALAPWGAPLFDATVDPRPLRGGVFGAVQPHALTRAAATRPVQCDVTAAQAAADAAARVAAARAQWRAKLVVRDPVLRMATRAGGDATQAARRRSLLADAPAKAALRHAHRIYGSAAPAREGEEGEREGAASGAGADDDRRDAAAAPLSIFAPGDGRAARAPPGRL